MVVDGDPEKPPEDIKFKEKAGTETRSTKKDKAEEAEPVLKKEPEPNKPHANRKSTRKTKPPSTQPYVGARVRSDHVEGVTKRVDGTIDKMTKSGKTKVFHIKWDGDQTKNKPEKHKLNAVYKGKNMLKTLMGVYAD
jgi:hypothetical protein